MTPPPDRTDRDALLHPELAAPDDESARSPEGRRLDHGAGVSRPLRPEEDEPQPRGAKLRRGRVDHAEAAERFLAAPAHAKFHDERLWDLREKRDREAHAIPEWEEIRTLASAIKEHTLAHLDSYLEEFEAAAKANGVHVHWARDGAEHNRTVHGILRDHGAKTLIKSKSMLSEECGFRHYMEAVGVEVVETDLGERIQQLDSEDPSHVVVPAVHKLRSDVAKVFAEHLGTDPGNNDVNYLAEMQREATRPLILAADAGMTGANFAVAETGSFVVCTNEGNADLSSNVPPLHIASIGIEKLIPRVEHLGVFIRLLSRSALGSPITQYTSHFRAPRQGGETHVVGLILNPASDLKKFSNLPYASTLNGSCTNVCPVGINIHEQIYQWRRVMNEQHQLPLVKKTAMRIAAKVLSDPKRYRRAIKATDLALGNLPRFLLYSRVNAWGRQRENPTAPPETFHEWYVKHRKPS
jgi:L-lactate dehydrogenase complex protein LldF